MAGETLKLVQMTRFRNVKNEWHVSSIKVNCEIIKPEVRFQCLGILHNQKVSY